MVIIVFFEIVVLFVERTVDDNSTMTEVKRRYPVRPREGSTRIFAGHPSIRGESEVCDYGYTGQALLQTVQTAVRSSVYHFRPHRSVLRDTKIDKILLRLVQSSL